MSRLFLFGLFIILVVGENPTKVVYDFPCTARALPIQKDMTIYTANFAQFPYPQVGECPGSLSGVLWYQFIVLAGVNVTISTPKPYTEFTTSISLYDGSCRDLNCLGSATNSIQFSPARSFQVYVAISFPDNNFGAVELHTQTQGTPAFVTCSNPVEIHLSLGVNMKEVINFRDTKPFLDPCSGNNFTNSFWFHISGSGDNALTFAVYDSAIVALSGTCGQLECIDITQCREGSYEMCSKGTLYTSNDFFLVVLPYSYANLVAPFTVELTEYDPTKSCESPELFQINGGSGTGTIFTNQAQNTYSDDPCKVLTGPVYWIEILVTNAILVTVSTCDTSDTEPSNVFAVYSGTCDALECYSSVTQACTNGNLYGSFIQFTIPYSTDTQTYYAAIGGYNGAIGTWDIMVSGESPPTPSPAPSVSYSYKQ